MKIALVSGYDYSFHGAVADHVRNLALQLRLFGHTVHVMAPCSDPSRILDEHFIPMGRPVPIPTRGSIARISLSIWMASRTKELLRKGSFDVVHLHEPFSGILPVNILRQSVSLNVGTFHTYEGTRLWDLGLARLARPWFKKLDGCIAVSEPARDFICNYLPGPYEIIPNGINISEYSNGSKPYARFEDGMINILFVGRLEKRKGLKYLLGAFAQLKWSFPNVRLLVVGPGTPDEDSYRIIGERNIRDVIFLGSVSESEKIRYYKTADIFCAPAIGQESFGVVLLEAMAAGKPIIATAIRGYSSVVTHEKEGLLVSPENEYSLADGLSKLISHPNLAKVMGANGQLKASNYCWSKISKRIEGFYISHLKDSMKANPKIHNI